MNNAQQNTNQHSVGSLDKDQEILLGSDEESIQPSKNVPFNSLPIVSSPKSGHTSVSSSSPCVLTMTRKRQKCLKDFSYASPQQRMDNHASTPQKTWPRDDHLEAVLNFGVEIQDTSHVHIKDCGPSVQENSAHISMTAFGDSFCGESASVKEPSESQTNSLSDTSQSPTLPPVCTRKRKSVFIEKDYQKDLASLSHLVWGNPGRDILDQEEEDIKAIESLRTCGLDTILRFKSPFTARPASVNKKRRTIAASISDLGGVPHLDTRSLSSSYKSSIEKDKILAQNLGGWDVFLTLKGQLASIDREFLETLLLETCYTEPRLITKIADYCIKSTDHTLLTAFGLK